MMRCINIFLTRTTNSQYCSCVAFYWLKLVYSFTGPAGTVVLGPSNTVYYGYHSNSSYTRTWHGRVSTSSTANHQQRKKTYDFSCGECLCFCRETFTYLWRFRVSWWCLISCVFFFWERDKRQAWLGKQSLLFKR